MKKRVILRVIFCLFLCFFPLFSKEILATYSISFGIFGEIAKAEASFKSDNDSYEIVLNAYTTGLAHSLSSKRKEYFKSVGTIKDGILLPSLYFHKVSKTYKKSNFSLNPKDWKSYEKIDEKTYKFEHKKRQILYKKDKIVDNVLQKGEFSPLEYYADNDLLSLFFNFAKIKGKFENMNQFNLFAVGANKKDGKIDVVLPKGDVLESLKEDFGVDFGEFFIVFINQKIFASKKGELHLSLDKSGICDKAVLKDVIFFGDIRGNLVEKNIR